MTVVAVDPVALAIGEADRLDGNLEHLIRQISWLQRRLKANSWPRVVLLGDTAGLLAGLGIYPVHKNVAAMLAHHAGPRVYALNDIVLAYNTVLDRATALEDYLGVTDWLADDVSTNPNLAEHAVSQSVRAIAEDFYTLLCIGRAIRKLKSNVAVLCRFLRRPERITVRLSLQIIEPDTLALRLPAVMNEQYVVFGGPEEYCDNLDPEEMWLDASNGAGLGRAIFVQARALCKAGNTKLMHSTFFVGSEFLQSIRSAEPNDQCRIALDACARLVVGQPKNALAEMWQRNSTGKRQQISREDGALAFRTHLTKRGEALRLMLWLLPDGRVEFANVGVKHELYIAKGNCQDRAAISEPHL